ncbi:MAG TPA: response regulator transcription factor [Thermoanaerobaculaceae bacterium]|nr:response regulator transcription factor [Thermoanaerobaculaceae bacterium]
MRVLIVDDHAVLREGLRLILGALPDAEVVGEAATGREAVDLAKSLRPDIVLMDILMPELNGLDATRLITNGDAPPHVIILSAHASTEYVFEAFRAGARGYLVKESVGREVVEAIREVGRGRRYVSPLIAGGVVQDYLRARADAGAKSPLERLSLRERQVVQLVAEGRTSAEIGRALGLSTKTVETYRSRLMRKLGVEGHTQLVRFALEHGLTPPK